MGQPFGLFSMTVQDLGLIGLENLNSKLHDFPGSVHTLELFLSWLLLPPPPPQKPNNSHISIILKILILTLS